MFVSLVTLSALVVRMIDLKLVRLGRQQPTGLLYQFCGWLILSWVGANVVGSYSPGQSGEGATL